MKILRQDSAGEFFTFTLAKERTMRYNNHKAISHRKPMEYPDIAPRGCGISEKGNFCPERGKKCIDKAAKPDI